MLQYVKKDRLRIDSKKDLYLFIILPVYIHLIRRKKEKEKFVIQNQNRKSITYRRENKIQRSKF